MVAINEFEIREKDGLSGYFFFTENAVFSREAGKRSKTRYKSQPVKVFCDGQTDGQMKRQGTII